MTGINLPNAPLDSSKRRGKLNFTAICWLTPTILLSNSPHAELLLWDLSGYLKKKFTPTLIHGQHTNGLFAIAGLADTVSDNFESQGEENWRTKRNM